MTVHQHASGSPALARLRGQLHSEVEKVVVGQRAIVDGVLAALSVGGHLLLEGAPGVAKTLLVSAVAKSCSMTSHRLQFTPDMLPSDVTGTLTLRGGELVFRPGPVFTNILLADEINRTPPKTQAALLEAMQEGQVSVDGVPHSLPRPFIVVATQNPIEYEGTYPLPEAQLDRFCMKLDVGYPEQAEEEALLRMRRSGVRPSTLDDVVSVASADDVFAAVAEVDAVSVSDPVVSYVAAIIRRTRELPSVLLGASPRRRGSPAGAEQGRRGHGGTDVRGARRCGCAGFSGVTASTRAYARGGARPVPPRGRAPYRAFERSRP